jgi:sec-independent protein translocase protein TatA
MFNLGWQELLIILLIVLLLFGGKRLPELTRSIGQSIKELRKGFTEGVNDEKTTEKESKQ